MVAELKQSIPFVVQAIPEVRFNGQRLAEKISDNINNLIEIGPCVQVIVTDNHSANVNEFSTLIKKCSWSFPISKCISLSLNLPGSFLETKVTGKRIN